MRHGQWTAWAAAVGMLAACGGGEFAPVSAEEIITTLVEADLLECDERREPFPEVVSCLDPAGDVTIALTEDGAEMAQGLSGDGPFLIGPTWVVLTFDGDVTRAEDFRATLGDGDLFLRGDDGNMERLGTSD